MSVELKEVTTHYLNITKETQPYANAAEYLSKESYFPFYCFNEDTMFPLEVNYNEKVIEELEDLIIDYSTEWKEDNFSTIEKDEIKELILLKRLMKKYNKKGVNSFVISY